MRNFWPHVMMELGMLDEEIPPPCLFVTALFFIGWIRGHNLLQVLHYLMFNPYFVSHLSSSYDGTGRKKLVIQPSIAQLSITHTTKCLHGCHRSCRSLHQQLGRSKRHTRNNHPPTKRCGQSHRTLVRQFDPRSDDPLRSPSSR